MPNLHPGTSAATSHSQSARQESGEPDDPELPAETGAHPRVVGAREICRNIDYRTAPLMAGLSIMPFSTPHIVAIVLYSPVRIRCSSARRSGSPRPESLATGQP